jgi:putative redox protein
MVTLMGITAQQKNIAFIGAECSVVKVMASEPRRVASVHIAMKISGTLSQRDKTVLENAAKTCPVARSLHPDIKQEISFEYV